MFLLGCFNLRNYTNVSKLDALVDIRETHTVELYLAAKRLDAIIDIPDYTRMLYTYDRLARHIVPWGGPLNG